MSLLSQLQREALIKSINQIPEFRYCGIAVQDKDKPSIVRPSQLPKGIGTWIILEKTPKNKKVAPAKKEFSIGWELVGVGFNCGSAAIGAAAIGFTTPFTGGTSMVIGFTGVAAATMQCTTSIARVVDGVYNESRNNEYLENNKTYKTSMLAVDAISLLTSAHSIKGVIKYGRNLSKATGKPFLKAYKESGKMMRAEKKRLVRIVAESESPGISSKQFKRWIAEGKFPKMFKAHEINQEVRKKLLESISSALGAGSSAHSGNIYEFTVYMLEESKKDLLEN